MQQPWLLCGDFNEIGDVSEKKGGAPCDMLQIRRFRDWIDDCNLINLGFKGTRFTWRGPLWSNGCRIFKRLDRTLCNAEWSLRFQDAIVGTLPRVRSDHYPLLIRCERRSGCPTAKPFSFEYMWMQHCEWNQLRTSQ
ncbi:uncharacterized protein LOC107646037 [Arachis ipaensis]|uniref:uncharacterized protein LOC107646037 n=1 Tax=Arachis ipaensis TaxID=130454 RepID=UPI0007AF5663|nr:uncharacterized protein LOC107646037 [Arachis ipaensis]